MHSNNCSIPTMCKKQQCIRIYHTDDHCEIQWPSILQCSAHLMQFCNSIKWCDAQVFFKNSSFLRTRDFIIAISIKATGNIQCVVVNHQYHSHNSCILTVQIVESGRLMSLSFHFSKRCKQKGVKLMVMTAKLV